jgi:hypothetical protein
MGRGFGVGSVIWAVATSIMVSLYLFTRSSRPKKGVGRFRNALHASFSHPAMDPSFRIPRRRGQAFYASASKSKSAPTSATVSPSMRWSSKGESRYADTSTDTLFMKLLGKELEVAEGAITPHQSMQEVRSIPSARARIYLLCVQKLTTLK